MNEYSGRWAAAQDSVTWIESRDLGRCQPYQARALISLAGVDLLFDTAFVAFLFKST